MTVSYGVNEARKRGHPSEGIMGNRVSVAGTSAREGGGC